MSRKRKETVRGLHCGKGRSADFCAGHCRAIRAAVTWLHEGAKQMNDPRARALLNSAAFGLGGAASWKLAAKSKGQEGQ